MLKIHILTWLFSLLLLNYESTSYLLSNDAKDNELLASNTTFPSIQSVLHSLYVSSLLPLPMNDSCEKIESKNIFPGGAKCRYYIESDADTRAIILTSRKSKRITVMFADFYTLKEVIFDKIVQVPLGPHGDPIIDENVKVRAGYNDLLFYYGLFFDVMDKVNEYHEENPDWEIYTSGHGLGGGLSLLMAAGISQYIPDVPITSISTSTPVVGNKGLADYMNNNNNINVWRYVLDNDTVPRVRRTGNFFHPGHTFQLNKPNAQVFYQHYGNSSLGYAGVPPSWNVRGRFNPAYGLTEHQIPRYVNYIELKSRRNPERYYAAEFIKCNKITCPNDYDVATF